MDDCNLQKLSVKPGKLSPEFNRNITEYNVTVASIVDKLTLDLLTSDNGASYSISVRKNSSFNIVCSTPLSRRLQFARGFI